MNILGEKIAPKYCQCGKNEKDGETEGKNVKE
jgi:hypothetical protein